MGRPRAPPQRGPGRTDRRSAAVAAGDGAAIGRSGAASQQRITVQSGDNRTDNRCAYRKRLRSTLLGVVIRGPRRQVEGEPLSSAAGTFPDTNDGFNSPFAESRERFDEYLDIIVKAWTQERFSFAGKYYRCDNLWVRPKPVQRPHPPIGIGITSEVTFPLVGRLGFPIIINPSRVFALSELAPYIQQYREAWHKAGHAGVSQVGLRVPLYVAKTAERAYTEPRVSTMAAVQSLGNRVADGASRAGTTGDWSAQAERVRSMRYEDWLRDKVVYGTPDTVVD